MATSVSSKALPSGARIPSIGLGVFQDDHVEQTYDAVVSALKLGYRHIDTARDYHNEKAVGRAVRDSGIPREQVFITSKVFPTDFGYDATLKAARESNADIGLGYIDLYLMHAPGSPELRAETWRALEDLQAEGVLKDIGVSNFGGPHLDKLALTWRSVPAVNQIEVNPWLSRPEVVAACAKYGILVQAYSPLAKSIRLQDPTVVQIAEQTQATPAQVLVAWSLAKDFITLPKSFNPVRQQQNLQAAKVKLSPSQIAQLDALDEYLVLSWDPIKDAAV